MTGSTVYENFVLGHLIHSGASSQRLIAEKLHLSVGTVNKALRSLTAKNILKEDMTLTPHAWCQMESCRVKNALILVAGINLKYVTDQKSTPAALIEINGETLVERTIRQLKEAGVQDISIVVGYMKEAFAHLMEQDGIRLISNLHYHEGGSLGSLSLVSETLGNTYIVPGDIWCRENPYYQTEVSSWYMMADEMTDDAVYTVNRHTTVVHNPAGTPGNRCIGIAYISETDALTLRQRMEAILSEDGRSDHYWEDALFDNDHMRIPARVMDHRDYLEINSHKEADMLQQRHIAYEEEAINTMMDVLSVERGEITDIQPLKEGLSNHSFIVTVKDRRYVLRIPGVNEDYFDYALEKSVYEQLKPYRITEPLVYYNANGIKITEYLDHARCCDPRNVDDLKLCMPVLKKANEVPLEGGRVIDSFDYIEIEESLFPNKKSIFRDYEKTKEGVFSMRDFLKKHNDPVRLTHIDANPSNFLIYQDKDGIPAACLIDWECIAVDEPLVSVATFCTYGLLSQEESDTVLEHYLGETPDLLTRLRLYALISARALYNSNWCEYRIQQGIELDDICMQLYHSAKEYYRIFEAEKKKLNIDHEEKGETEYAG